MTILSSINNFIFWKDYILHQEVCREKWYTKKWTKYSQDFIRESLIQYWNELDYMALMKLTSYSTIKRILYQSKFYCSYFDMVHNKTRYTNIYIFLEYKFNNLNIFQRILFYILFWWPRDKNMYHQKFYSFIKRIYVKTKNIFIKK